MSTFKSKALANLKMNDFSVNGNGLSIYFGILKCTDRFLYSRYDVSISLLSFVLNIESFVNHSCTVK